MLYTDNIINTFFISFFAFFATVSPINTLIIFMSSSGRFTSMERRRIAIRCVTISSVVLITLMLFGTTLFAFLGIEISAIRTAGGLLLLMIAFGMMFGDDKESVNVADSRKDISVFPMAVPVIAGPAGITTSMLVFQNYESLILKFVVFVALVANLALTMVLLLLSEKIITRINKDIMEIFLRIAGLILASLAIQFIFDGIRDAKLFQ